MASSKSFQKGQIALLCQMCEESSEIKWKCLTCESYMCSKCCKIHRKFKSSDKHVIVDLKDIALHSDESGKKTEFTNTNCSQHKDQKCCLYCKVCEEVVCPICIAKVHNTHKMVEISEGYQLSLGKIKNMNSEVKRKILKFTTDLSNLDSIRFHETSHYRSEKEKILNHERAIKDAVERHTKKLLTLLDNSWKSLDRKLKEEEKYAVKVTEDLESQKKALNYAMTSNNANEVFKMASEKKKSQKPVNTKHQKLPRFVPGEINPMSIEIMHGIFEETKEQKQIQVKEKYNTSIPFVQAIVCCNDGSVWISDTMNNIVQNLKLSDGSIHVNKTLKHLPAPDMALTPSGDLLVSTLGYELLIIRHTKGKVEGSKFDVSPLITTAVHVSTDDKIIIGARDNGPYLPATGPRQVIVMDMEGKRERVYQFTIKNKPLFTYPYKITTDEDNNIYVIDHLSNDDNGRVVALGDWGGVRGIYTGHPDVNDTHHRFTPKDIVSTQSDNIIVSDYHTHTLHILNNNLQCVQYLNTEQSGFKWPGSLFIDNRGYLFIGCNTGQNEPNTIHVLQAFG